MEVSLTKRDITEVKSFGKPPQDVKDVLLATCILLGHPKDTDWKMIQRIMGDPIFINSINNFEADECTPEAMEEARKILAEKDLDKVKSVNMAAFELMKWCQYILE